ncbi:hypothetical protein HPB50_023263 [Hyalomma asiaticum]|uniref:Uncharacterized protein n=1 Tax=Hyalomma asiaticum TaxID=266040 RepID=A0ACB7SDN9_HYAAI|nr:hypothetical protein HPB50_023263 [Hyalomma asiaticum]
MLGRKCNPLKFGAASALTGEFTACTRMLGDLVSVVLRFHYDGPPSPDDRGNGGGGTAAKLHITRPGLRRPARISVGALASWSLGSLQRDSCRD